MHAATCFTPMSSSSNLNSLAWSVVVLLPFWHPDTYLTSSRIVVRGNSGPYLPNAGSPSLLVTGLAVPYGLPKLFMHITKNLETSKALPGPPIKGPHQSLTSALPESA